jgi:GDP/UDP-N,N'-diacetylbacillosamine 2-epimerase (hydrolysing)
MRIGVLTSSRADYGIYLPLLKALSLDCFFSLEIIAFGTHLSKRHGYTVNNILNDGFNVKYQIETTPEGDSAFDISHSMAITSNKFAFFWEDNKNNFDIVFCLGDRYEMFSAVSSSIPFNIKLAHLHGGEKTLGAIDNIFRHSITLASTLHFVSCRAHGARVAELTESEKNIFDVGSLSLDNIKSLPFLSINEFFDRFRVDLSLPTILLTIHPETVSPEKNARYVDELIKSLLAFKHYQVLITLPNADTSSLVIRNRFLQLPAETDSRISCHENLGTQGYFTAMKYCLFLLGNTSSGIIEAASLQKWVINLGDRQKGRQQSNNIVNSPFEHKSIIAAVEQIEQHLVYEGENIYFKDNVAQTICTVIKKLK